VIHGEVVRYAEEPGGERRRLPPEALIDSSILRNVCVVRSSASCLLRHSCNKL